MGGSIHLAHHACLVGIIFHRYFTGQLPCSQAKTACSTNCLVSQEVAYLFRCLEPCEGNTLATKLFSNILIPYPCPKNTAASTNLPLFSLSSHLFACFIWIKSS